MVFHDIRLCVVKTEIDARTEGVEYCGTVNMSHKGFHLSTLQILFKKWPGEYYIVMYSNPRAPYDIPLMDIL